MNIDSAIAELNAQGYYVNFFQHHPPEGGRGWSAAIFSIKRKAEDDRWYGSGAGLTLDDALAAAILELMKPRREYAAVVRRSVTPAASIEDLL